MNNTEIIDAPETESIEPETAATETTEIIESTETEVEDLETILPSSDHIEEDPADLSGSDVSGQEAVQLVTVDSGTQTVDVSSDVSIIFILSMIVGLLVFMTLSWRWKS